MPKKKTTTSAQVSSDKKPRKKRATQNWEDFEHEFEGSDPFAEALAEEEEIVVENPSPVAFASDADLLDHEEDEPVPDETEEGRAARKLYPPPSTNKIFRRHWNLFIGNLAMRKNFTRGHLTQLRVLCEMYVEYERLKELIDQNGYTFTIVGRNGMQIKLRPEVAQQNRVKVEIRNYSRVLGLILEKDESRRDAQEEGWD